MSVHSGPFSEANEITAEPPTAAPSSMVKPAVGADPADTDQPDSDPSVLDLSAKYKKVAVTQSTNSSSSTLSRLLERPVSFAFA